MVVLYGGRKPIPFLEVEHEDLISNRWKGDTSYQYTVVMDKNIHNYAITLGKV